MRVRNAITFKGFVVNRNVHVSFDTMSKIVWVRTNKKNSIPSFNNESSSHRFRAEMLMFALFGSMGNLSHHYLFAMLLLVPTSFISCQLIKTVARNIIDRKIDISFLFFESRSHSICNLNHKNVQSFAARFRRKNEHTFFIVLFCIQKRRHREER